MDIIQNSKKALKEVAKEINSLNSKIGNLNNLTTSVKTDLVNAINSKEVGKADDGGLNSIAHVSTDSISMEGNGTAKNPLSASLKLSGEDAQIITMTDGEWAGKDVKVYASPTNTISLNGQGSPSNPLTASITADGTEGQVLTLHENEWVAKNLPKGLDVKETVYVELQSNNLSNYTVPDKDANYVIVIPDNNKNSFDIFLNNLGDSFLPKSYNRLIIIVNEHKKLIIKDPYRKSEIAVLSPKGSIVIQQIHIYYYVLANSSSFSALGDKGKLTTTDKSNVVAAINELVTSIDNERLDRIASDGVFSVSNDVIGITGGGTIGDPIEAKLLQNNANKDDVLIWDNLRNIWKPSKISNLLINDNVQNESTVNSSKKTFWIIEEAKKAVRDEILGGAGAAYDTLKELKDSFDEEGGKITDNVLKGLGDRIAVFEQTFTNDQKEIGRKNIDVYSKKEIDDKLGDIDFDLGNYFVDLLKKPGSKK